MTSIAQKEDGSIIKVPLTKQDRERYIAEGRETHDLHAAVICAGLGMDDSHIPEEAKAEAQESGLAYEYADLMAQRMEEYKQHLEIEEMKEQFLKDEEEFLEGCKLAPRSELIALIRAIQDSMDMSEEWLTVTVGTNSVENNSKEPWEDWDYRTGDNPFSGGAYRFPLWGVVDIRKTTRPDYAADRIIEQITEKL